MLCDECNINMVYSMITFYTKNNTQRYSHKMFFDFFYSLVLTFQENTLTDKVFQICEKSVKKKKIYETCTVADMDNLFFNL